MDLPGIREQIQNQDIGRPVEIRLRHCFCYGQTKDLSHIAGIDTELRQVGGQKIECGLVVDDRGRQTGESRNAIGDKIIGLRQRRKVQGKNSRPFHDRPSRVFEGDIVNDGGVRRRTTNQHCAGRQRTKQIPKHFGRYPVTYATGGWIAFYWQALQQSEDVVAGAIMTMELGNRVGPGPALPWRPTFKILTAPLAVKAGCFSIRGTALTSLIQCSRVM
jgi:hypothetical protein